LLVSELFITNTSISNSKSIDYLLQTHLLVSELFITLQKQLRKFKDNIKLFITNTSISKFKNNIKLFITNNIS